ncbi:uncharacterized protein DUF2066 [Stella humosa]|uniref:Uncharacterized protein DUF2066 n=1 Tax=Stella humosa TaxID=94 RepID=A0A3N1M8X7_9PROT|nr:DUF2066 domain-containing protein [Stella humosa]ROP99504.1 uncharacterized protein DUF2066 [Stella humosa]BBK31282.1 hypothetical protein STHU_19160 [Stella humosa]
MIRQRPASRLSLALALAFGLATGPLAMPAAASDLFTIPANAVDVTAATAVQARERALADAQQAAARKLIERLVVPAGGTPPRLSAAQVATLVQDVEIADERVSAVRYIANVTVRFRPDAVRSFLRDQGIVFSERAATPILVLPVLDQGDGPMLFDDRNGWLRAWADRPAGGGPPLAVPLGDLADVGALTAGQALSIDRPRIAALARRYGADEVAIVRAAPAAGGNVAVTITRVAGDGPARVARSSHADPAGDFAGPLRATIAALERPLAPATPPPAAGTPAIGQGGADLATAPAGSAEEWIALRRRIAETPGVERVDIVALGGGKARVRITHRLDADRLRQAMGALGVQVDAPQPLSPPPAAQPLPAARPPSAPVPLAPTPLVPAMPRG